MHDRATDSKSLKYRQQENIVIKKLFTNLISMRADLLTFQFLEHSAQIHATKTYKLGF